LKYFVRLNPKAINPLTLEVNAQRLWEVEQANTRDSEAVIWHAADVKIDKQHVRELFQLSKQGEQPWQIERYGVCVRSQDNALEIITGSPDASGN
jgi:hypothetical protein